MSTLTKDRVDEQWKEITEFEKTIPGIRYGGDYPEFALAVVGSKAFESLVTVATMTGMLGVVLMPKPKEGATEQERKDEIDKFLKQSPIKEEILRALYLGYKLGKGESQ